MRIKQTTVAALTAALFISATSLPAWSEWQLDGDRSAITFLSTKNLAIAEQHRFDQLNGSVTDDGRATVNIELASVESLIPIRNERMREMLFEVVDFPLATLTATVEPAVLESLLSGGMVTTDLPVTVKLHGKEKVLSTRVAVMGEAETLHVIAVEPVLVAARDFGLDGGVEALRDIAGLNSISSVVPVSFALVFEPVE
ncbi:MAG: YceI family protein [Pseudomonadota bacterium]